MPEGSRMIANAMRHMLEGPAWHGPSVREAIEGMSAEEAAARVVPGVHTIFELVHHMAAWAGEVEGRLRGQTPGLPRDGDFPPDDVEVTDASWSALRQRLIDRHGALMEAVRTFPGSRLDDQLGEELNAPLGTGFTFRQIVQGLIEHDAYHTGQIVILRRAWAARRHA